MRKFRKLCMIVGNCCCDVYIVWMFRFFILQFGSILISLLLCSSGLIWQVGSIVMLVLVCIVFSSSDVLLVLMLLFMVMVIVWLLCFRCYMFLLMQWWVRQLCEVSVLVVVGVLCLVRYDGVVYSIEWYGVRCCVISVGLIVCEMCMVIFMCFLIRFIMWFISSSLICVNGCCFMKFVIVVVRWICLNEILVVIWIRLCGFGLLLVSLLCSFLLIVSICWKCSNVVLFGVVRLIWCVVWCSRWVFSQCFILVRQWVIIVCDIFSVLVVVVRLLCLIILMNMFMVVMWFI